MEKPKRTPLTVEELARVNEDAEEAAPCQESPESGNGSRYKRGRRWWEQSKWERKR